MGADLITYIAFGPRQIELDQEKKTHIAKQVREYLDACVKEAELDLLGEEHKSVEELRGREDYHNVIEEAIENASDYGVEAEYVFASLEDLAEIVQDFVNNWNDPCFRDMATREDPDDPDRIVVVAGDMSWGDEPDGGGYQLLKQAFGLNFAELLGVK